MTHEPTNAQVANAVGVSQRTLTRWRQRDDYPRDAAPSEILAWAESVGLGRTYDKADSADLRTLKVESLRRDIAMKDAKLAAMRGEVVDREVMRAMLRTLGQKWDLLLRLKLEVELGPRVAGKSAAEANVEGSRILDEIREVVNNNLARFEPDVVKQSKSSAAPTAAD
jgi:hypothetical protein